MTFYRKKALSKVSKTNNPAEKWAAGMKKQFRRYRQSVIRNCLTYEEI